MWTEEGTGHGADVVMLEKVVRDPGRVWVGVVLPQMVFPWRRKNDGMVLVCEHLVNTLLLHFLDLGQDFER